MIDNNIAQSLGVGSGIDTNSIVRQLVEIERIAPQGRIDSQRETAQSKISDFGLLKSALSTLQSAAQSLSEPEGLFSKTASFTESDAIVPSSLSTDVQPGIYNFELLETAQSQSLSFASLPSSAGTVGEGTLTFNFGTWERDTVDGPTLDDPQTFTENTEKDPVTITIDSTNNTLEGLRDAINAEDAGVQASIVFDGTGYRLSVLAESGEANEVEINVAESGAPGLSSFAFNAGVANFVDLETQKGQDAELKINGLTVNRPSNFVEDVVEGLSLDLLKASPGEVVNITIEDDKAFAEDNIRTFVDSYNAFLDAVDTIFNTQEIENEDGTTETVTGSLASDSLAKSTLSQIRGLIAGSIPGLTGSDFSALTNVGIRTELDGTISIDETWFRRAFDDNFEDVQKVFSPQTVSSSGDIYINSTNENTAPGAYDVVVTTAPSKGAYESGAVVGFPNLDTSAGDYTFKVNVNGTQSDTLTIPVDTYATEADLASAMQSAINGDTTLKEAGARVTVSYNSDDNRFDISSTKYGSSSQVNVTESGPQSIANLGLVVADGTSGTTAAGTINGVAGFGSANVLLPKLDEPGQGLALVLNENSTTATVNFSRGFAGELDALLETFLENDGLIDRQEGLLADDLSDLTGEQESLDRRIGVYEERLIQQYIAMERIIGSLNSSGSFIENLIDTLPFTAKNN